MVRQVLIILCILVNLNLLGSAQNAIPSTFTIDGYVLSNNKKLLADSNGRIIKAFNFLIKQANQVLTHKAYSIVYKTLLPPSGSPHDFLSFSTYYWPVQDSGQVSFNRRDGFVSPMRDKVSDRILLLDLRDDIKVLSLAYYYTGNELYAQKVTDFLKVFFIDSITKMNPNFEYAQVIPGDSASGGATVSAIPFLDIIEGVQLIKTSKYWNEENDHKMKIWFRSFADWMLNSNKGKKQAISKNNIGTYYVLQTIVYSLFSGDTQQAKDIYTKYTKPLIDIQIAEDGSLPFELNRADPWNYIKLNLNAWYQMTIVSSNFFNEDLWLYTNDKGGNLRKAFEWLFPFTKEIISRQVNLKEKQVNIFLKRFNLLFYVVDDNNFSNPLSLSESFYILTRG